MPPKKRISVASAKAKARDLQNWVAQMISELLQIPWGRDEMIAPREMGQSGTDVRLVGPALREFPFSVECKNQETWNVHEWIRQAKDNRIQGTNWVLFAKKNRVKPIALLDYSIFCELKQKIPCELCWTNDSFCKENWSVLQLVCRIRKQMPKNNKWSFEAKRKDADPIAILDAEVFFEILRLIRNRINS